MGCLKHWGSYLVVNLVIVMVALATLVVVWRASEESREQYNEESEETQLQLNDEDTSFIPTRTQFGEIQGVESFQFLLGYGVEVALALFVYWPIFGTLLFSGVLGCRRLPFIGGRPREVRLEQQKAQRRANRRMNSRTGSTCSDGTQSDIPRMSDVFDDEIC